MKKKILLTFIIGTMLISALTGCNNSDKVDSTKENITQDTSTTISENDKSTIIEDIFDATQNNLVKNDIYSIVFNGSLKAESENENADMNLNLKISKENNKLLGEITLHSDEQDTKSISMKVFYPDINNTTSYYTAMSFNDSELEWTYFNEDKLLEGLENLEYGDVPYNDFSEEYIYDENNISSSELDNQYYDLISEYILNNVDCENMLKKVEKNFTVKLNNNIYSVTGTINGEDIKELFNVLVKLFDSTYAFENFNINAVNMNVKLEANADTKVLNSIEIDFTNTDFSNLFNDITTESTITECKIKVEHSNTSDISSVVNEEELSKLE